LVPQAFCPRISGLPRTERITTESSVAARQCPFSYKKQHTDFYASQLLYYPQTKEWLHQWINATRLTFSTGADKHNIMALWKKMVLYAIYAVPPACSSTNPSNSGLITEETYSTYTWW
jgi:hypothetical protein